MWVAYSNKGTKIELHFWDWTCMYKVITDYVEELGLSEDEAYTKFWEDVKNYNKEEYDFCLNERTFDEALGNGLFDELRTEYLDTLNIDCEKIR